MEQKTAEKIRTALAQPFAPEDLEWRLQMAFENQERGIAVPYVTNRAIQNRLDDVVGPDNWYNDYKPWHSTSKKASQLCGISIYFEEKKQWITKWDGAEDSDIEPVKGGLSDSMKRAAVQWGIGRVLYGMNTVFVDIERKGKSWIIKDSARKTLDNAYLSYLEKLGLTPAAAGGTQAQLTPKQTPKAAAPKDPPAAPSKDKATAPQQETPQKPAPQQKPQAPPPPSAEEPVYTVLFPKVQNGANGPNTRMVLEGPDGKRVSAFLRGSHPELTDGMTITGVRLTMKKQDTVVFHILEDYRVVSFQEAA